DAGLIRAGLIGHVYAGWLFVNLLWVHRELRRRGIGQGLLAEAERRALALGCHSAWLDTFSFQGPDFYPKFGYTEFARLDYPPEHQRKFPKTHLIQDYPRCRRVGRTRAAAAGPGSRSTATARTLTNAA